MKRLILVGVVAVAAAAAFTLTRAGGDAGESPHAVSGALAAQLDGQGLDFQAGTRRSLGAFELRKGHRIALSTADTADGKSCLIEHDESGDGSSCLDGGFFRQRRIEFVERSEGAPDQLRELFVAGIVAPVVRAAQIVLSDGRTAELSLTADDTFVFESPQSDLEQSVYPSGFRLYGPSGKLVQTVTFPVGS